MSLRVLVAGDGAPDGRTPAARLFAQLRAQDGVAAQFLGRIVPAPGAPPPPARILQPDAAEARYVAAPPGRGVDPYTRANRDAEFAEAFEALVEESAPDIVHVHGLAPFGAEVLLIARRAAPQAGIVLSPDAAELLCPHHGSLRTRPALLPCPGPGPAPCAACFPERDAAAPALRARWLRLLLEDCDRIVLDSAATLARHEAWGLPAERLVLLPQVGPAPAQTPPRTPDGVLRVGLLGPPTPLGALAVALDAMRRLDDGSGAVELHILGDPATLPPDLAGRARTLLDASPGNVRRASTATPAELDLLLGAPLEAHALGRPSLPADDAEALAAALERLAALPYRLNELAAETVPPPGPAEAATAHLALYRALHQERHGGG